MIECMPQCLSKPISNPESTEGPSLFTSHGMVGVRYSGTIQVVKTNAKIYEDMVLESIERGLNTNQHWTSQEDSAPAHKAVSMEV